MAYSLTWEPKGVYAKFVGTCDFNDVWQAYQEISNDSRSDDIRGAIFDYLDVKQQNTTESEIEMVAGFDVGMERSLPSLRFASVTTDKHTLELWRHFVDMVRMPGRHGIFPTVSSARGWLAVSQPKPGFLQSSRFL